MSVLVGGTEEQKRRFLPDMASGKLLGCYALTEADAVRMILSLSQLLDATGLMKLENGCETSEEEVHGVGESERSRTGA